MSTEHPSNEHPSNENIMLIAESKPLENAGWMYLNQQFSDVSFVFEQTKIPGHRAILAVKSAGFEILFDANPDQNEFEIPKTSPEAFKILLKYIYAGTVTVTLDVGLILQVIDLACRYSFTNFVAEIFEKFDMIFSPASVISLINEANGKYLPELREECCRFFDRHALETLSSDTFIDLTEESVIQILKRPSFSAPEIEIFKSAAKWCENNNNKHITHVDGDIIIAIRLTKPVRLNHIRMKLGHAADECCYSYYIEASLDQKKWHKIVDYSKYACRGDQNLYFDEQDAQYIKFVGTNNCEESAVKLFFEAMHKSEIPQTLNGVIRPTRNVANAKNGTIVFIEGNCVPVYTPYVTGYCSIGDNASGFIVQLAQPYRVSSMELFLNEKDAYKYIIETSTNKTDWELLIDKTDKLYTCWQDISFPERIVVFIKITGKYALIAPNSFYIDRFECPAERN